MSSNPPLRFSHSHHLLSVKGCDAELDVLAFEGDEALSTPFSYRTEFTSADHAISKEMMLMKAASLTLQAPVDQGYGIKIQQPVRVIQGVVTGFERLGTSKDETRYAVTLEPRLALLSRSHQNAVYQDMSVPQIVEKILRERHGMRGQDFLFSLSKEYPRREQVMQYAEDDLHFITRLLGEVGIWFRFTTDTRLNIDVVEFYDSQQGYEKGLTLPSVPPSGQHAQPIAKKVAGKITGFLAWEILGIRILAVLMTWEVMVAITLLQVVVTWISDDELQIWCRKCVFGTAPFNRSLTDQNKALEGAIKDIS